MSSVSKTAGRIAIPKFQSEHAEAEWFDRHRRPLSADMRRRLKAGEGKTLAEALAQSATKEKARLKPVTIRMLPDDLDLVRRLAFEKGLPYQTFIKVLLREALVRQTRGSRARR
jgi:predicted DNA binding CopG/RHH family protein